jgi:protein-S-isoprenylcysteine O-methyltransferase Ste14
MWDAAAARMGQRMRLLVTRGALAAMGGVLLLAAVVILLIAVYAVLAEWFGAIAAAGMIATLLVILGLFFLLLSARVARAHAEESPRSPLAGAAPVDGPVGRLAYASTRSALHNPIVHAAGLALAAGLLLGRRSKRKRRRRR